MNEIEGWRRQPAEGPGPKADEKLPIAAIFGPAQEGSMTGGAALTGSLGGETVRKWLQGGGVVRPGLTLMQEHECPALASSFTLVIVSSLCRRESRRANHVCPLAPTAALAFPTSSIGKAIFVLFPRR